MVHRGFSLARDYFTHADIANIRSNLELKSAHRLLNAEVAANPNNFGAQLALAVTLMRLGDYDNAQKTLDALVERGATGALFAKTVRAELYMLTDREPQARRTWPAVGY